jgi:hypothetical protein
MSFQLPPDEGQAHGLPEATSLLFQGKKIQIPAPFKPTSVRRSKGTTRIRYIQLQLYDLVVFIH